MEEWRAQLAASIQGGLEESDEDEEWEQEVFLEAIVLLVEDSHPPSGAGKVCREHVGAAICPPRT